MTKAAIVFCINTSEIVVSNMRSGGVFRSDRRKVLKTAVAGVVASLGIGSGAASAQSTSETVEDDHTDVTQFGFDLVNTGLYQGGIELDEQPDSVWTFNTDERVASRPAIVDQTVYASTDSQNLYAIDRETGDLEWEYESGFERTQQHLGASPTVVDDVVYVAFGERIFGDDLEKEGLIVALDEATGEEQWATEFDDTYFSTSPVVSDGRVYVGGWANGPYALNSTTGEIEWEWDEENTGIRRTVPAIVDESLIFATGQAVVRVSTEDGEHEWTYDDVSGAQSSPAIVNGTVYVGANVDDEAGKVVAIDLESGDLEWKTEVEGWASCSPSVRDGTVYIGTRGNNVYALDADEGDIEWEFDITSDLDEVDWVTGKPAVVDGIVYVGSWDYRLYALDADTGDEYWSYETGGALRAGPVAASDGIYAGSWDRNVHKLSDEVPATTGGFEVEITSPEDGAEINEDRDLDITVDISNTSDTTDTQDVVLVEPITEERELELDPSQSREVTFTLPAAEVDGDVNITVESNDDSDSITVTATDPCFIATAAYDTPRASEIDALRAFRDDVLKQNALGRLFTDVYYRTSPPIANWIRRTSRRRYIVREYFVAPLVTAVETLRKQNR